MKSESASQHLAEVFDDTHGAFAIVVTHEHGDRVECVEKKVRIELCLQGSETSAGELFGKSCHLHFTLAHFDEIARCVFDPDDAEINRNAERQRDEDPA